MSRDYRLYCDDVLESISKIERYVHGLTLENFLSNILTFDAVIYNLLIIGEAIGKIPKEIRDKFPDIEWAKIISMRNLLIHEYFGIDKNVVWNTVRNNIPVLKKQFEQLLNDLNNT